MTRLSILPCGAALALIAATPALAETPAASRTDGTATTAQTAKLAKGSGERRYCYRARAAGDYRFFVQCATRAQWADYGVILAQR